MNDNSAICAISTPAGTGAIAVIRLSGINAIEICDKIFKSPVNKSLINQKPNTLHYGSIIDNEEVIDNAIFSIFRAPHSYTGENSVEISVHGSQYIQQKVLQILIKSGARIATPGEFTLRAFLNGKMDLSQAEAVADLIASSSEAARRIAMHQVRGGFSDEISQLRQQLIHFISLVELELDFSEEDVQFADRTEILKLITKVNTLINNLLNSYELGNVIKNGIPVVIIGEPNVGKSTLLNALLREEKAIVSHIAGTTRDVIEDVVNLQGIAFRFIDTAGLRETADEIETLGIEKTHTKIKQASIIILMIDANNDFNTIKDNTLLIKKLLPVDKKLIFCVNKIDKIKQEEIDEKFNSQKFNILDKNDTIVFISAKHQTGVHQLSDILINTVNFTNLNKNDVIITNARHYEALKNASVALLRAKEGIEEGLSGDLFSQDVREALLYLGEITGEISNNEILGNIFKNFCIGK